MRHLLARIFRPILMAAAAMLAATPASAQASPPGASSCTGCHAAASAPGSTVPRLHGRPAGATIAAMAAFKSGRAPATVMDRIAKGFSEVEIAAIADWYATQR